MKKKTTEQFVKESKNIHGNKYDYSQTEYKNIMDKVTIICPTHGKWEVSPDNHVGKKSGCPKCKGLGLTKEEKILKAHEIHQYKYDYSLITSKNIKNKSTYPILCPEHGEFKQTWGNHYNMKQGCPKCNKGGRKKFLPEGVKNSWGEDYTREYMSKYYQDNKEKFKNIIPNKEKRNKRRRERWKNDPKFKLHLGLRNRINEGIKKYNYNRKNKSIEELGCSIENYILYLEKLFDGNMTWGNYGSYWEIDHIKPLSKGGSFHYTNTQPLTINKNRSKGNKII